MESPEDFEQHLAQIIWDNRWKNPHALQIWQENYIDAAGAKAFALEHCVFGDHFPRWFGSIVANCPYLEARQYMIENMYVEEVVDPTINNSHYESLVDFAVALGCDRDFVYNYKGQIYTRMAVAYWERASRAWPWLEGFAAVGGLEAARGPAVARIGRVNKMTRAMWQPLGLSDKDLAHWAAGEAADFPEGGHGDMTLKILAKYADSDDKQARVMAVIEETTQIRWFHFDNIGRDALEASGVSLEAAGAA